MSDYKRINPLSSKLASVHVMKLTDDRQPKVDVQDIWALEGWLPES
jgi:hypothetical protein